MSPIPPEDHVGYCTYTKAANCSIIIVALGLSHEAIQWSWVIAARTKIAIFVLDYSSHLSGPAVGGVNCWYKNSALDASISEPQHALRAYVGHDAGSYYI